jgi:peptidoglycan/xylan/chitin deacetylase (PgdA/CDA1 family)
VVDVRFSPFRETVQASMNVYLTIDDGPSGITRNLTGYLKAKGIGAILFCRGDNLEAHREVELELIRDGFIIGNHSYNHKNFDTMPEGEARVQIHRTDRIIDDLHREAGTLRAAKYFRFPYGQGGRTVRAQQAHQMILCELGYWAPLNRPNCDWRWNLDFDDWNVTRANSSERLKTALERFERVHEEMVLLLHDNEPNFETRLFQNIIEAALRRGIKFHSNEHLNDQAE